MKTTKTITTQKTRAVKCVVQIGGAYFNSVTFAGLEELCDDPKRNESNQEVQAVLTPHKSGFSLSARDGELTYEIIDENGRQLTFRTVEMALDTLSDVPHLLPEIVIDALRWGTVH